MKFTKEEVSLCKQIAERYRKEIEYGDWFYHNEDKNYYLWMHGYARIDIPEVWFPLWTLSDCLKFLREKGFMVRLIEYENYKGIKRIECNCYGHKTKGAFSERGNKDEEACLKAVLAVFEEK